MTFDALVFHTSGILKQVLKKSINSQGQSLVHSQHERKGFSTNIIQSEYNSIPFVNTAKQIIVCVDFEQRDQARLLAKLDHEFGFGHPTQLGVATKVLCGLY